MTSKDRWPALLELASQDDGLPVRDCGSWTEDKLWFWARYVDIVSRSMANHPHWNGVAYIDLFAGPGICEVRGSKKRLPGSAIIAANAPKKFTKLLCSELLSENAEALAERLKRSPHANVAKVVQGNCNEVVAELAAHIPDRSLTLAFIDPPNLDIQFDTLRQLVEGRRVDLLILLADAIDIVRNVDRYEAGDSDRLDKMFPPSANWRSRWESLENRSGDNVRELFASLYEESLARELGYSVFRQRIIRSKNGPLYRLIFASQHERGAEFWDKVTHKQRDGQQSLFGP